MKNLNKSEISFYWNYLPIANDESQKMVIW